VNEDAVREGSNRYPDLTLLSVQDTRCLPFSDSAFESVSLLDVFEHLDYDYQSALLTELRRVLVPGGLLILTVPRKHVFSFMDVGNAKFRFPRLHRFYYSLRYGREKYEYRYVCNPFGLVGDIAASKRWHEHFSPKGLRTKLERHGFQAVDIDGSGLFTRPLVLARLVVPVPVIRRVINLCVKADAAVFSSMNLFISCVRSSVPVQR
jgi:SAM-dependent methyltransferase